jgi:hypothetical protein
VPLGGGDGRSAAWLSANALTAPGPWRVCAGAQ